MTRNFGRSVGLEPMVCLGAWMRRWPVVVATMVLALPGGARAASYLQDDLTLSATRPTEANPQSGSLSDNLSGQYAATGALSLTGHLTLTHEKTAATPTAPMAARFPRLAEEVGGYNVALLGVGADLEATPHLALTAALDVSPKAQSEIDTSVTVTGAKGNAVSTEAFLHSESSSASALLGLSYDTADLDAEEPSMVDFDFGFTVGATRYATLQRVDALLDGEAKLAAQRAVCKGLAGKQRPPSCAALLGGAPAAVVQLPIEADVTATFLEDTDVGLSATYFAYSEDPTQVGLFTVASAGARTTSFGTGIPLAPLRFTVRPDVGRAFGPVTADLFVEYGQYVDDEGHQGTVGLKLKWKISKHWRASGAVSFSRDTPGPAITDAAAPGSAATEATTASTFGLGLRYTF